MDQLLWVRQVRRLTCDLRITIKHLIPNGNIFKIEYESITVSSFLLKNIVKIEGMSIADYTFAEVTEVFQRFKSRAKPPGPLSGRKSQT